MPNYSFLQVDVISKRENSLGYIGGQVNSLTGLPSLIFFRLIRAKSIVEDSPFCIILDGNASHKSKMVMLF